jgi:hypothetical protein
MRLSAAALRLKASSLTKKASALSRQASSLQAGSRMHHASCVTAVPFWGIDDGQSHNGNGSRWNVLPAHSKFVVASVQEHRATV